MRPKPTHLALVWFLSIVAILFPVASPAEVAIEWYGFSRSVIASDATDPLGLIVKYSGSPTNVGILFADGSSIGLTNNGDGTWSGQLTAAQVLYDYMAADLNHNFIGHLVAYEGGVEANRFNLIINVFDEQIPAVPVWDVSSTVRVSPHVVNIYKSDLLYPADSQFASITQLFYGNWPDEFDFINLVFSLPSYQANRDHMIIKNDIDGIGHSLVDNSAAYGSAGRLLGRTKYPIDYYFDLAETASIHELGHQWINYCDYTLLQQPHGHWPIGTLARGIMGYDIAGPGLTFPYELVALPSGDYEMQSAPELREFTDLDLYLMGLVGPGDVGPNFVFSDPNQEIGPGKSGPVTWFDISSVITAQGTRVPDVTSSPKAFRVANLVVTRDRVLDDQEMAVFDYFAARGESEVPLPYTSGLGGGTTNPFYVATGSRATLNTSVDPILYVDANATGLETGYSWMDAMTRLDTAVARANAYASVREIWVAEGEYYPTDTGDRSASFFLRSGLALYGGFSGVEATLAERDWLNNQTTLNGDIGIPMDDSDNSYHVVTATGTDATAVIDGFTIKDGNATGGGADNNGGGIYMAGGAPTIANVVLAGNAASGNGGAMFCGPSSGPGMEGVVFEENSASINGGGLYVATGGVVVLQDVIFRQNSAASLGGAIASVGSNLTVVNGLLYDNTALVSGGGMYNSGASTLLTNVTCAANNAAAAGGGMYNVLGSVTTIKNSIVALNSAVTMGDEIYNSSSTAQIASSLVYGSGGSGAGWDTSIGSDGGGNLDADPRFRDVAAGDARPWSSSPAINAGDDASLPTGLTEDLDGQPRIYGAAVDMGAYEYQGAPTGIGDEDGPPAQPALYEVYPNPFNPLTTIRFFVAEAGPVSLRVYDVAGRLVCTLVDAWKPAGEHRANWNGRQAGASLAASGVYFLRLETGSTTTTRKVVMLK